jgi:hypothetical protein
MAPKKAVTMTKTALDRRPRWRTGSKSSPLETAHAFSEANGPSRRKKEM